jgi:hypothetical protein
MTAYRAVACYNQSMIEAPKQNWQAYAAATALADAEWVRGLSTQDRLAIYEDAFDLVYSSRGETGDWDRLDHWRFHQKAALYTRLRDAFTKLDRERSGPAASTNAR